MKIARNLLWFIVLFAAGCNLLTQQPTAMPTDTPTPIPSNTPQPTVTFTPSHTATITPTPLPTNTATPVSTATPVPTPSNTPRPTTAFTFDNWELIDIPENIRDGIDNALIAFINQNNRDTIANLSTGEATNDTQILYFASPTNPAGRIPILETTAETGEQIYISPAANAIAYFRQDTVGGATGLYMLDFETGVSNRVLPISQIAQRGFLSEPVWSPDGNLLAVTIATGYDLDIFVISRDGTFTDNLTHHGAYDMWPSWSPDGKTLLFVSDRNVCASWIPGETGTCDGTDTPPPNGGHPFLMDMETREVRQLSDEWLTDPPRWLNNRQVTFGSGDVAFGDPERTIWIADVVTGDVQQTRLADGPENQINIAEAWSPDGSSVVFQSATATSTEIVLANRDGSVIGRTDALSFARFSMAAAWSPDGTRLAIGGVDGQCPHGITVFDNDFNFIARGVPPPGMCEPVYSPNGQFLAFEGVLQRGDGRIDIYSANANGFAAINLTRDLRGQIKLLGWVGGDN
ncbi:MAG: hypothetical protein D6737_12190 [Chloroflexi bacterium]|nr:MAG: hypothetical protein CUN54_01680 [Phototrophicales bacterium]RMF79182.1 MAG: hypothetical protein D6737_12190 [Chloroflexota bacterium]